MEAKKIAWGWLGTILPSMINFSLLYRTMIALLEYI